MANKNLRCLNCREYFPRESMTRLPVGHFHAQDCIVEYAQNKRDSIKKKKLAKDTREKKQRIKTRSEWIKEAQQAVNAYVRIRDKGKPCCSCDKPDDGSHQRHASHYRSTKACSSLRFNTLNIWASCAQCNTMESGNLIEYRIRLNRKYPGLPDWLESQNDVARYDIDYLKRLISVFRRKSRLYKRLRDEMAP